MRHLIVFALLLNFNLSSILAEDIILFETDLEKAFVKAKSENKIVLVDFVADWCLPCKVMDQTTFKDPQLKEFLQHAVIPVKIDIKYVEGMFLKDKYEVHSLPTLIIFDDNRNILNKIESTVGAVELLEKLKLHGDESYTKNKKDKLTASSYSVPKTKTQKEITTRPAVNIASDNKSTITKDETDYYAIIGGKYSSFSFTNQYLQELRSVVKLPLRILKLRENGYILYAINVGSTGTKTEAKKTVDRLHRQRIKASILQL